MVARARQRKAVQRDPAAERLWVEQLSMLLENTNPGFPRTSGRILGLMLIADEPTMTQSDLAQRLVVSQASVSPALRYLTETGHVERLRVPGVRAEQYRLRERSWSFVIHAAVLSTQAVIQHLEGGLALPGPDVSAGRAQLGKLADVYRQLHGLLVEAEARIAD